MYYPHSEFGTLASLWASVVASQIEKSESVLQYATRLETATRTRKLCGRRAMNLCEQNQEDNYVEERREVQTKTVIMTRRLGEYSGQKTGI